MMSTKQGQFFIDIEDLEFISRNGKSTFNKLKGQNILIIGATSFVGMWVTEAILYADIKYNLEISITLISRNKVKTIERFKSFISSGKIFPIYKSLQEVQKSELFGINQVVNLATLTDSTSGDLQLIDNIQMFQKFWSLLDTNTVKNILFTSSGAAYGKNPEKLIHLKEEDAANININYKNLGYGLGKISSEYLGFQWAERDNFNFKVARLFSFSGAFLPLKSNYVIGNFINNVINNEPLLIKNPGKVYRSFLYGAELALWLWKILVEGNNTVYNVGSDKEVTTIDLAKLISDMSCNNQKVIIMTENIQNNESYIPNIEKIKKELSVDIKYNLSDSIIKMINWYKKYEKNGI
jgi:nucleoside-diphosphate-sugar epimerase